MPTALIAGAGIAGLAAALGLSRAGWGVTVLEAAPAFGEVGAGLQISPNAARVLDWLGVLAALDAQSVHPVAGVLRDGETGKQIYRAAFGETAARRWGAPYLHLHRADLHEALASAAMGAGATLRLNAPIQGASAHPDGAALNLQSGETLTADLVIAADGVRSTLRPDAGRLAAPRFTGQTASRALIPAKALPGFQPQASVWAGEGRHLVSYLVRGGALINLVGVLEQSDWAEEGWSVQGEPSAFRAAFAGWHPKVEALLAEVRECFLWGLFDRPAPGLWAEGRVVAIGDAAHPMLPFMAQGAAMALEDVAALVRHLNTASIAQALAAWQAERQPRVQRVIAQSQSNGRMFHRGPGLVRTTSRAGISLVSKLAPGLAAGRLDWLYGFDAVRGPT